MKNKHIIEIQDSIVTALVTMRDQDGSIYTGFAKGTPGYTESLALSFGTFVAIVQALEALNGPETNVCKDLRELIRETDLEGVRAALTSAAATVAKILKNRDNHE